MATITRENIGLLNEKVIVKLTKEDYLPAFEQSIKKYAKTANLPGFRKGMVPASLVKKMYGQSVFTDEVLRKVEKELNDYVTNEQLDIFAQPLPFHFSLLHLPILVIESYILHVSYYRVFSILCLLPIADFFYFMYQTFTVLFNLSLRRTLVQLNTNHQRDR